MKIGYLIISLLLLVCTSVFAQTSSLSVEGLIKDTKDKSISNVPLELSNANDPSVSYFEVSDELGRFKFQNIPTGSYQLNLSGTEYNFPTQNIHVGTHNIIIPDIILAPIKEKGLVEIEVIARKKPAIEVKHDMTVFNVQSSPTSTGLNGLDLLRKSPGVSIDNDNNVLLKGSRGTRIFINGKPSYMDGKHLKDWLSSIRSEDIARIEIISNPSAKYDAEGTGGIVNFVMKKGVGNKNNGFNATLTTDVAMVLQNEKYQGSYNLALNYRNEKLTLGGSYGFSNGTDYWFIASNRTQNDFYYKESTTSNSTYNNQNAMINFDYAFNDKHALSANLRLNYSNGTSPLSSGSDIDTLVNRQFDELLRTQTNGNYDNIQFVPSLSYTYKDSLFGELTLTTDYSYINNTSKLKVDNRYYADENATLNKAINIFGQQFNSTFGITATKVDWNKTWGKLKLEAGLKYSYAYANNVQRQSKIDPTSEVDTLDVNKSSRFIYQENILAAYLQAQYTLNKFTFLVGLRNEYTATTRTLRHILTDVTTSETTKNYNDLFPSAGITFRPSESHAFALQYVRRIMRPYYSKLNPFDVQQSELLYDRGNPNLAPQYSNKLELSYTFMGAASVSLGYSELTNAMLETFRAENKISYRMTENIGQVSVWNATISTPLLVPSVSWWMGYLYLSFNYTTNSGVIDGKFQSLSYSTLTGYIENNFRLPAKFTFGFSAWFTSPSIWAASIRHQSLGSLDVSIQKKLLGDKLNIKLYMQDVLNTTKVNFFNRDFGVILDDGVARWASRRIGINLAYTFGKNQTIKPKYQYDEQDDARKKNTGGGIKPN